MRPFSILIVSVSLFISCQNQAANKAVQKNLNDSVAESKRRETTNSTTSGSVDEEFQTFWKKFRTAVIAFDTAEIISLTRFPFQTRGDSEYDPTIGYGKKKFVRLLNLWNGKDANGNTELDMIKGTEVPNKKDVQDNYARIDDFVFRKEGKNWKFVFAYLNYETIDSLKK